MKKRLVLLLCIVCCTLYVDLWAVPAKPGIITLKQQDGTGLQVRLCGDENYHYYETLDGKRMEMIGGRLKMMDGVDNRKQISKKREHRSQSLARSSQRAPHQAERGLVILVEFSDLSFVKTRQDFFDLLNKKSYNENGATGSARDYFNDASNGQYDPQFDVYGPYKLSREMGYYGQNDADGNDMHPEPAGNLADFIDFVFISRRCYYGFHT